MTWSQLQTILWLRWRLSLNQWLRGSKLNAVIAAVAAVVGVAITLGGAAGGLLGGAVGLTRASPTELLLVWDGVVGVFLFLWALGVVTELQRSETVDIGRLLHLPVSLKGIFLVNYAASHLRPVLILFLPGMLGLAVGLAIGRGPLQLGLVPLVLSFVFMVTAWTYCLRGWLVSLMVNQRRRRTIIVGITMAFILVSQAPNLYFNVLHRRPAGRGSGAEAAADGAPRQRRSFTPTLLTAHAAVPVLWTPWGARALAEGRFGPALLGTLGALLLGGLGLHRAYRGTLRFYQGFGSRPASDGRKAAAVSGARRKRVSNWLERDFPGLRAEAAAMAWASLRSFARAPEVRMAFLSSSIALFILGGVLVTRRTGTPSPEVAAFITTGGVALLLMSLLQLLINQFGFDREGFRALVLLPTPRREILLGKNLALTLPAVVLGAVLLLLLTALLRLPVWLLASALLQFAAGFFLACSAGNLVSILAPFRVAAGALKPTKMPLKSTVLVFVLHLFFPLVMLPLFLAPALGWLSGVLGWWPAPVVNMICSVLLCAGGALGYRASLDPLAELLQRREQRILQVVTQEVE